MRTRFARALALIAALHLLGGHWVALQGVAWVTMVVDFSKDSSLVEAVGKTLDGQHPCSLCKAVAAGKEKERERQDTLVDGGAKLVAVLVAELPASPRPFSDLRYFVVVESPRSAVVDMLSPPPRAA